MTFSRAERQRLAELLLEKGPDAPTLCEGWKTHDLAVHLWIRENRPDAAAGMMISAAQDHLESTTAKVSERPYEEIVKDWQNGPGTLNPVRLLDRWMNLAEHFVHHEDVRRGQWMVDGTLVAPRDLTEEENSALVSAIVTSAKMMLKRSRQAVCLVIPGRITLDIRPRGVDFGEVVVVKGEPGEILLWLFGREAVHLDLTPEDAQVQRG
ncbi:uncharacterized protein (TIGR03085 family) [Trueperella bonasi]|uniref:Uncharacterized protein (TIGR03085 family) n=1 Tax=Trueperella bonasi TaxID=312286 RepID=A0ABT9NF92_9ACTO|nr:TIGR03085 family metal-binding protein [Trueperella bonasi]MDP9806060.1 uncharacterized protein (TIGR03085 family) [Trueperella bonasi]